MYIIFNHATGHEIKAYKTERAALIGLAALHRKIGFKLLSKCWSAQVRRDRGMIDGVAQDSPYGVCHYEVFNNQIDTMVTVIALQTGKPVTIRRSQVGGCTDPSTERYWAM